MNSKQIVKAVLAIMAVLAFSMQTWASTYQVLYNFTNGSDGGFPVDFGTLAFDPTSGNIYGTTSAGGTCGQGTLFELSPNPNGGWTETVLHSFCGQDGSAPEGGPIIYPGFLEGTTLLGGSNNVGTGFLFILSNGRFDTWSVFCDPSSFGCLPFVGPSPNYSGLGIPTASFAGGANGRGALWYATFVAAYSFCSLPGCADGANPASVPIADTQTNLYGTTRLGGTSNQGVVYECFGTSCTVLHSFAGGPNDGAYPFGATPLLTPFCFQNLCGNTIWGTTPLGGAFGDNIGGYGTVWNINPLSGFGLVHSFDWFDGGWPYAGLTTLNGTYYGTTSGGGGYVPECCPFRFTVGQGTVYSLTSGGALTTLHVFTGSDGALPYSGLVADSSGNLYGVTNQGGTYGYGVVYEITP